MISTTMTSSINVNPVGLVLSRPARDINSCPESRDASEDRTQTSTSWYWWFGRLAAVEGSWNAVNAAFQSLLASENSGDFPKTVWENAQAAHKECAAVRKSLPLLRAQLSALVPRDALRQPPKVAAPPAATEPSPGDRALHDALMDIALVTGSFQAPVPSAPNGRR